MVVERVYMHNGFKMQYLQSCLHVETAKSLRQIPALGDSFADAWTSVKDYYRCSRLLTIKVLCQFYSLKPTDMETSSWIRTSTTNIHQALDVLASAGNTLAYLTMFL